MKVKIQVIKGSKIIEEYTVPDGSWVQTETLGAQHVPAVTKPIRYDYPLRGEQYQLRFEPIAPPRIPPKLEQLLDGRDPAWGRNGFEWMGKNRAGAGGTVLDRAREACWRLTRMTEFPLKEDPAVVKFCETGLR